jgi:uncharacterized protein (TIGR02145 family)
MRAYATNMGETAYSDQRQFRTMNSTVTDIDGNQYYTLQLCSNEWLTENLKTTRYRNGESISLVEDSSAWSQLVTGAMCYYNNDLNANKLTYGALYNWHVVDDERGLCPEGWHVPEDSVWINLRSNYLVINENVGGVLKEVGTVHWMEPNESASNESSFTALPAGWRFDDHGEYENLGRLACFWTSTEYAGNTAFFPSLSHESRDIRLDEYGSKNRGMSVRCIKDK